MIAVSVATTAYSAYAANKAGKLQKQAYLAEGKALQEAGRLERKVYDSQAQMADYNAAVAELQAQDALARGEWSAERMAEEIDQVIGSQRVGFAAGNIDVGFGSSADTQADAAALGALDISMIRANAAAEAWGFQVQSEDERNRAAIYRMGGENAERLGELGLQTAAVKGNTAQKMGNLAAWGTVLNSSQSLLVSRYGSQWTKTGSGW
jgi:hypothetical protein